MSKLFSNRLNSFKLFAVDSLLDNLINFIDLETLNVLQFSSFDCRFFQVITNEELHIYLDRASFLLMDVT